MKYLLLIITIYLVACSKNVEKREPTSGSVTYTIYEPINGVMTFSLYSIHWCLVEGEDFQRFYKDDGLTELICGGPNMIKLTVDPPCGTKCRINFSP